VSEPYELPVLDAAALKALCEPASVLAGCEHCRGLNCPGWESVPGGYDTSQLSQVGTLRKDPFVEPTLDEQLPPGTTAWSADAPIAIDYAPYNRCGVWICRHCHKPFLRYTEYGGYYSDERIRAVAPKAVLK